MKNYLNQKWFIFRAVVEILVTVITISLVGVWSFNYAYASRGYLAFGSEFIFALACGFAVGYVSHMVFNKVERKLNLRIHEAFKAKREVAEWRKNREIMFVVGDVKAPAKAKKLAMFKIQETEVKGA